jgi:hypothetical protein
MLDPVAHTGMELGAPRVSNRPNASFFAGDLDQRIFQQPFSWKSDASRPPARPGSDGRGRQRRIPPRYGLGIQRTAARDPSPGERSRGNQSRRRLLADAFYRKLPARAERVLEYGDRLRQREPSAVAPMPTAQRRVGTGDANGIPRPWSRLRRRLLSANCTENDSQRAYATISRVDVGLVAPISLSERCSA